jgi:hypothetical protein
MPSAPTTCILACRMEKDTFSMFSTLVVKLSIIQLKLAVLDAPPDAPLATLRTLPEQLFGDLPGVDVDEILSVPLDYDQEGVPPFTGMEGYAFASGAGGEVDSGEQQLQDAIAEEEALAELRKTFLVQEHKLKRHKVMDTAEVAAAAEAREQRTRQRQQRQRCRPRAPRGPRAKPEKGAKPAAPAGSGSGGGHSGTSSLQGDRAMDAGAAHDEEQAPPASGEADDAPQQASSGRLGASSLVGVAAAAAAAGKAAAAAAAAAEVDNSPAGGDVASEFQPEWCEGDSPIAGDEATDQGFSAAAHIGTGTPAATQTPAAADDDAAPAPHSGMASSLQLSGSQLAPMHDTAAAVARLRTGLVATDATRSRATEASGGAQPTGDPGTPHSPDPAADAPVAIGEQAAPAARPGDQDMGVGETQGSPGAGTPFYSPEGSEHGTGDAPATPRGASAPLGTPPVPATEPSTPQLGSFPSRAPPASGSPAVPLGVPSTLLADVFVQARSPGSVLPTQRNRPASASPAGVLNLLPTQVAPQPSGMFATPLGRNDGNDDVYEDRDDASPCIAATQLNEASLEDSEPARSSSVQIEPSFEMLPDAEASDAEADAGLETVQPPAYRRNLSNAAPAAMAPEEAASTLARQAAQQPPVHGPLPAWAEAACSALGALTVRDAAAASHQLREFLAAAQAPLAVVCAPARHPLREAASSAAPLSGAASSQFVVLAHLPAAWTVHEVRHTTVYILSVCIHCRQLALGGTFQTRLMASEVSA